MFDVDVNDLLLLMKSSSPSLEERESEAGGGRRIDLSRSLIGLEAPRAQRSVC